MAHLSLSLLGPFQVTLDKDPIKEFKSNKVRALLAYLAVEADRPHRRESLAGLLWPDWPNRDAMSNLRYALSDLRRVIGDRVANPPFLLISRESIQFNKASDYCLDVQTLTSNLQAGKDNSFELEQFEKTIELYRGDFLEGFSLDDSPAFEEWTLLTRERLARQTSAALRTLTESYEQRGNYEKARSCARRQLELEPWDEIAHQQLMRMLALEGRRNAALSQYETCRKLLADELDVEPTEETTLLYEQIRDGNFKATITTKSIQIGPVVSPPAFLTEKTSNFEAPVFVARTRELEKLNKHLKAAIDGNGGVVFITGEAGSGKTSLLQEFIRRAQEIYPNLLIASGDCNAYTGIGDPYLPFREILEFLTGDVESRWAVGAITREHAIRIWEKVPVVAQALVEVGPDLIDSFIQRVALLERVRSRVSGEQDWLNRLGDFLDRKPVTALNIGAIQQVNLFEQYTKVLKSIENQNPILLVIDDLQWADTGSINMLFHLGRRLSGCRILLLGAYRSEEVALGREGVRHPLELVINEFRRSYGEILLNLGQTLDQDEGRGFIDEFLDEEPNHLDESFREMLYQQTQGHPLFTIELLRGLQERGDIFKDPEGYWVAGPSLDWETLPVRVEAVVQERIGRLPKALQKALEIASIEGEIFTAEVIARVQGIDEQEILGYLSVDLDRSHRLVRAQSIQRFNNRLLSRYQFRHILFQKYLYSSLDEVLRVHLHEQVGVALEDLYGIDEGAVAIAVQLALHFQIAQIDEKTVHYLKLASDRAIQLSAYQEVIAHVNRALEILASLPASLQRDQQELDLQLALAMALQAAKGAQVVEVRNAYDRARELCSKLKKENELVQVLGGLAIFHYVRAEHFKGREYASKALQLAEIIGDPLLIILCHWYLGFILFCLGDFANSIEHLQQVTDSYNPDQHHQGLVQLRGSDAGLGAMAYEVCCLWCLGYPDQASQLSQKTMELANKFAHPFTLADVTCFAGCTYNSMRRDGDALMANAEALIHIANDATLEGWLATGMRSRSEALVLQGVIDESAARVHKGMDMLRSERIGLYFSGTLATLVDGQLSAGFVDEARSSLDEAFRFIEDTDERYWEAELYRLKGELLLADGEIAGAEACLKKAIEIAQKQKARSLELRAAMSLSKMWGERGKTTQAYRILSEIYNWFTEGFDTPDLIAARELLDQLSQN